MKEAMQRDQASHQRQRAGTAMRSPSRGPAAAIHDSPRLVAQRLALGETFGGAGPRGLPSSLKAGIAALSGMDLSDVRVYENSAKPAAIRARAFAQGADIHLGPGQEQHLPHEAWHIVQQRQGRVQATTQEKGVGINDDSALEREATEMGELASRTPAGATGQGAGGAPQGSGGAAQRVTAPVQRLGAVDSKNPLLSDDHIAAVEAMLANVGDEYWGLGNYLTSNLNANERAEVIQEMWTEGAITGTWWKPGFNPHVDDWNKFGAIVGAKVASKPDAPVDEKKGPKASRGDALAPGSSGLNGSGSRLVHEQVVKDLKWIEGAIKKPVQVTAARNYALKVLDGAKRIQLIYTKLATAIDTKGEKWEAERIDEGFKAFDITIPHARDALQSAVTTGASEVVMGLFGAVGAVLASGHQLGVGCYEGIGIWNAAKALNKQAGELRAAINAKREKGEFESKQHHLSHVSFVLTTKRDELAVKVRKLTHKVSDISKSEQLSAAQPIWIEKTKSELDGEVLRHAFGLRTYMMQIEAYIAEVRELNKLKMVHDAAVLAKETARSK